MIVTIFHLCFYSIDGLPECDVCADSSISVIGAFDSTGVVTVCVCVCVCVCV